MKQVGLADIKTISKWAIPAGILTLGTISVIAAGAGPANFKGVSSKVGATAPESRATASPAPDASPAITVNGVKLPIGTDGTHDVAIPGGKAHVEVSGGQTKVTAKTSSSSGDTSNTQTGNVDIQIDSQNLHNNSNSSTSSSSTSITSTSIFSTGNSDVTVTH